MVKQSEAHQKQPLAHHRRANQGVTTPCSVWDTRNAEKILASVLIVLLFLTACCAPATSNATLLETAFTATFLGLSNDGQTLLVQPEQSKDNVQLVYKNAENLVVGQRVYVVGRLEGNQVYVTDLRLL